MIKKITGRTWNQDKGVWIYTFKDGSTWENKVQYELGTPIKTS